MSNRREEAELLVRKIIDGIGSSPWNGKHRESIISEFKEAILSFSNESVRQERESCADIAESFYFKGTTGWQRSQKIAQAIRNRQGGER